MTTTTQTVDRTDLEAKVKEVYRQVAQNPFGEFHFAMGRSLAERLGYSPADLDRIPRQAVDSFAGVGFHFDLAAIAPAESVLDLGSGSGMDSFIAAVKTGEKGRVHGLDMTDALREKAESLAVAAGFAQVTYHKGYIEQIPFPDGSVDVVISNGVINLSADKPSVFREAARVLKPGGRFALSDIVTEKQLPGSVSCNATLWAACIGGALQQEDDFADIRNAGLQIEAVRDNPQYVFLSDNARNAALKYGVKSVSLVAVKT
jgi:SAM-dependent methyltransferase